MSKAQRIVQMGHPGGRKGPRRRFRSRMSALQPRRKSSTKIPRPSLRRPNMVVSSPRAWAAAPATGAAPVIAKTGPATMGHPHRRPWVTKPFSTSKGQRRMRNRGESGIAELHKVGSTRC